MDYSSLDVSCLQADSKWDFGAQDGLTDSCPGHFKKATVIHNFY